jgi:hypothetical protein
MDAESHSLTCLLQPPVPAAAALRSQAVFVSVVGGCSCGCPTVDLNVDLTKSRRVDTDNGVVTARIRDLEEGLEVMVFIRDGVISSLELTFADTPPQSFPPCDHLEPPIWHASLKGE